MKKHIKKKIFIIILLILALLGSIAYWAANRYLIDHVVIDLNKQNITNSVAPDTDYEVTDDTYTSDTKTIKIKKVETGSGNNKITYFVADVTMKDASQLLSAFAENKFGQNIIDYTSNIAKDNNAIFAINGDYYGFRKDGIIIRNGVLYRDKGAREGLAFYSDGSMKVYDEKKTSGNDLIRDGVINTLSFGPALLKNGEIISGIEDVEVDTNFGNHSIQGNQPRTGIGMIDKNHFVFIVVDGRSKGYSKGVTMTEFAEIFKDLGCTVAYNIDGGGSSVMYFNGEIVNNPLGRNKERGTSDIMYLSK